MKQIAPKATWLKALASCGLAGTPAAALAGFSKPLQDIPEHLGTGALTLDQQWVVIGLVGLVVVVALLAGFYSRDK